MGQACMRTITAAPIETSGTECMPRLPACPIWVSWRMLEARAVVGNVALCRLITVLSFRLSPSIVSLTYL
jgi:hypothetical protein